MSWITQYITTNDFVGEYFVPSQSVSSFNDLIKKKTKTIIKDFLGLDLYKVFVADIESAEPTQKYIDLRDGVEFVDLSGANVEYDGFKSFLIPFIYSYVVKNNSQLTAIGVVKTIGDNSELISDYSNDSKAIDNWNVGVSKYYEAANYIQSKNNTTSGYYDNWVFSHKRFNNNIV